MHHRCVSFSCLPRFGIFRKAHDKITSQTVLIKKIHFAFDEGDKIPGADPRPRPAEDPQHGGAGQVQKGLVAGHLLRAVPCHRVDPYCEGLENFPGERRDHDFSIYRRSGLAARRQTPVAADIKAAATPRCGRMPWRPRARCTPCGDSPAGRPTDRRLPRA